MAHKRLLLILLLASGCASMEHSKLISPSETLYNEANEYYEGEMFNAAIKRYKEFLEKNPNSKLAVPANLNLGMSHYHNGDYHEAYLTLKDIKIKDENIKKYVDGIIEICKTEAGDEIEAEEKAQLAAAQAEETSAGPIEIQVLDAYLDDFGSVVLKGKTDTTATVIVGGNKVTPDQNNIFTATVNWKKGDSISISAKGISGGSGDLNYFPDGERPYKPQSLQAINITSNSIEIEWFRNDRNDEDEIKGYRLFYRRQGGSLKEVQDLIKDTKHEVIGFGSGSSNTIEFFLRAVDKMNNESDDSDILEADLL